MSAVRPPLVSVVIPYLDPDQRYFREAVSSVLAQDYRPLEIIFVDDGSSESFAERISTWCATDSVPIRILSHENKKNRGVSASRNLGIANSNGKYVAFLDSDDVWLPGKILQQCAILERNESVSLTFGLTKYWFEWCNSNHDKNNDFIPAGGFRKETIFEPPCYLTGMLRGSFIAPSASNMMARRESVLKCGGFEDEFPGLYDDQVFVAKLTLFGNIVAAPVLWDMYRQHPESMTARADQYKDELTGRRKFLRWISDYCDKSGLHHPSLEEAIAKALWLSRLSKTAHYGAAYHRVRWAKKWLLRLEERVIPRQLRWIYWNRSAR